MDLNPLRNAAARPLYLNSISSTSVRTSARLQSCAKKKVVSIPPIRKFHQSQFPDIPLSSTNSATARGVSAANVVATMDNPAINQGRLRPPRKKEERFLLAFFR